MILVRFSYTQMRPILLFYVCIPLFLEFISIADCSKKQRVISYLTDKRVIKEFMLKRRIDQLQDLKKRAERAGMLRDDNRPRSPRDQSRDNRDNSRNDYNND